MARHTFTRADTLEYGLWLIFDSEGGARMTRGVPSVDRNERAVSLTVTLPKALFRTPSLSARLTIDAPDQPLPSIDVRAAQEALRTALGVDIDLRVNEEG